MVAAMQRAAEESSLSDIVLNQIHQTPGLKDAAVNASADQGLVTLTGYVKTDAERIAVEEVARQVQGVKAIADELLVKPSVERSSAEIAREVLRNLRSHVFLAAEDIKVIVRDGRVTLEGVVHQELQKMLAAAQVNRVQGISGVSNQLEIKPDAAEEPIGDAVPDAIAYFGNGGWVETGEAEAG
ncbi:MAG TPA: BON domain-containing protein [Blastocatellia bacterium]|nr:BON domain-containing protein [Blastocatellia bacterium]